MGKGVSGGAYGCGGGNAAEKLSVHPPMGDADVAAAAAAVDSTQKLENSDIQKFSDTQHTNRSAFSWRAATTTAPQNIAHTTCGPCGRCEWHK